MMQYSVKDLFQLQTDLVEAKVEIAVNKTTDRIIERIDKVVTEIHELNNRFAAVETRLGMRNERQREIRNRTIEYTYKVIWFLFGGMVSAVLLYFR
jgi:tRNA(Ser,Leu) C12 N-acetylase TAN1